MEKNRLEAFSDGVLAIIITIMVLELAIPTGDKWADLKPMIPTILEYFLSFLFVAIYWVNHHLMLKDVNTINVKVLWSNNALLFVMSFIPFATGWVGKYPTSDLPLFLYFFVMFLASVAFHVMAYFIADEEGQPFKLTTRGIASLIVYLASSIFALFSSELGSVVPIITYTAVALITVWWLVPAKNNRHHDQSNS